MMKSKLQPILRIALLLLIALLPPILNAHDFEVDGIFYKINGTNATVTYKGSSYYSYSEYSGTVTIPATVAYNGTTYTVTSIGGYAFCDCSNLTKVTIPNSVTSIGGYAFLNCSGLTSVTIPNSVTSIDGSAFQNCSGLTSVTIPNSVTSIGGSAFQNCSGLTSVTIPNSVTSIGGYAFYQCSGLTSVTIPNSVTSIGNYAFSGCSALKTLNYNAVSCADFGNTNYHPFYNSGITAIYIGNNVQKIPANFALNLKNITSITIPIFVTSIGDNAFTGCSALKTINYNATSCADFSSGNNHPFSNSGVTVINIGNSVEIIPVNFAYGMPKLSSVNMGNSIKSIGSNAFYNCSGLSKVNISDLAAWCRISFGNGQANPLMYAHHLFLNNEEIKDLVIPNSINNIYFAAFYGCSGLTSVTIPNSVYTINKSAFCECSGLINVSMPNSVSYLGSHVFYGCSNLTSITIPDLVKSIYEYTFYGCSRLSYISLGNSVASIGQYSFYNCSSLVGIKIPDAVTTIGDYAFYGCTGLNALTIGKSLTSLGTNAFTNCAPTILEWNAIDCGNIGISTSNITSLTIGSYVKTLPNGFVQGSKISAVSIPNSVSIIGSSAFQNCSRLTSVSIPIWVSSISKNTFSGCSSLASVTIPVLVTSIGDNAFSGCNSLAELTWNAKNCTSMGNMPKSNITKVTVGSSVETLPAGFVSDSKITSINLSRSLTSISQNAFLNCRELKSVTIPNSVTTIDYQAFSGCTGLINVTIGNSVTTINDNAFSGCSSLTNVTVPNSVTSIGGGAFSQCTSLTDAIIGNSVQTIGGGAFYGCENLTDLTIGNSVHTINYQAFANCKKLMYVSCFAIMPPEYNDYGNNYGLFDDITYQNAILYVPDLTYGYYKQSEPWKKFMEIKAEPYADGGMAFDSKVYPTSVRIDAGDENEECYFIFDNKQYQPLLVTGLEPNNIYSTTYTRNWGDDVPLRFYTSQLMMVPEGGKMLNATTAQLMAETNMADEETMCGFDWRRSDGPEDYLGTRSYCPVYDGKMAGTLKNLSKDTWYKFRPFYKSSAGNVYYGDWVTFYSGDWGVEFDPVVYTYQSPAVTQTDATLQGVALRGSSEITEQGFEYWKSGTSNVKKVTASGERMSATVNGLDPETSYKFRAFVTSDGKTLRGSDVEFVTRSGEHHVDNVLDVNADGIVNIADMNVVINVILRGNNDRTCDVNGDGLVNISDLNAIISSILAN